MDYTGGNAGPVGAMGYGELQPLSLSMSSVSQSSCVTAPQHHASSATANDYVTLDPTKKRGTGKGGQKQPVHRKSIDTFGQRTSQYRAAEHIDQPVNLFLVPVDFPGITSMEGGKLASGGSPETKISILEPSVSFVDDLDVAPSEAYDIAAIKFRGSNAVTNFDMSRYDVEKIMASSTLLSSEHARRNKNMDVPGVVPVAELPAPPISEEQTQRLEFEPEIFTTNLDGLVGGDPGSGQGMDSERTEVSMLFGKAPSRFISTPPASNTWMAPTQMRSALPLAHMPVFAAWTDA
ncbi:hypothetical protein B296_00041863 [Ensete ventricosum]|uniref:AP2/ERF domain-containing protein n=1 Tax=Ensete ventricosum TaxID=4639 RepID=A0A426YQT1_ENSVE|nr:hypothetical protein B296_00041863 [Ensete ventricosum]